MADHEPTSAQQLEAPEIVALVEQARQRAAGEREGLFGPRSESFRVLRELGLILAGGRALLLQIAHPAVAAAVAEHSDFRVDPLGRARRTFEAMFAIHFGSLDEALAAARRVRLRHQKVHGVVPSEPRSPSAGRPYRAEDPALLLWVFATLVDSARAAFEAFIAPLSDGERERLYEESKQTALVLGIDERLLPADHHAFQRWFEGAACGPELVVTPSARAQARILLAEPPSLALAGLIGRTPGRTFARLIDRGPIGIALGSLGRLLTAGLLPPNLRAPFGLRFTRVDAQAFEAARAAIGVLLRRLPPTLRFHPAYFQAMDRLGRIDPR